MKQMNILKIIYRDLKDNILCKKFVTYILVLSILIFAVPPYGNILLKYQTAFLTMLSVYIVLMSVDILGKEFELKTYKVVFSGVWKRYEVLLYKVLFVTISGGILGIIYNVILKVMQLAVQKIIFYEGWEMAVINSVVSFIVYSLLVSSTGIFILVISKSYIMGFIILFLLFIDSFSTLIPMLADIFGSNMLKSIVRNNVFTGIVNGFMGQRYEISLVYQAMLAAVIFYILSILIFSRKDL